MRLHFSGDTRRWGLRRAGGHRRLLCLVVLAGMFAVLLADANSQSEQAARVVRGPYLQVSSETAVTILWRTDQPTVGRVEYGTEDYREGAVDSPRGTRHAVRLTGLRPGTRYLYRVMSRDTILHPGNRFTTHKRPGSAIRFAVLGDSGSGERGQYALAARILAAGPDFILHTGDVIYPRGAAEGYDARFFRPYAALLQRLVLWPSLGNHDVMTGNGRPYLENFVLPANGPDGVTPERNYTFDYGDAHFVALDSTLGDATLRDKVAPWLRRDLAATRRTWRFVFFHHAPYSAGLHGESARVQRLLVPALAAGKAHIVFSGHDHTYERIRPRDGVTYIVTGAGGGGLYQRKHPRAYTARFHSRDYSYTLVDLNPSKLRLRQITAGGTVVDEVTMTP